MATGVLGARMNLVLPAQIQPAFPSLPEAYHHERWLTGYFPSSAEWAVAIGMIAIGICVFLLAKRVLPLEETA
jgi:Ni/Fe-hydrogenase subunit HybB-like protein